MRSAVTISLVPEARGGPFVFWDGLEASCQQASALGFDAVELYPPDAAALNAPDVSRLLRTHQLQCAAVGTGAGWVKHKLRLTDPDRSIRLAAIEFVSSIIDAGGALGAPAIIGSIQGRQDNGVAREQAIDWLREALSTLAERAANHGVPLLYEPLNRYESNLFNRQSDAAAFLSSLRPPNVKLLCDLFHMNIEEASLAEALRAAGPLVGHVHFADSNRQAVGWGHTDMKPVIAALREINYTGYLSAEVLPLPDSVVAARQTIESYRRWTATSQL
ncbi:MAG TPA: sugar phosphate isomerase/epimerase family protein [Verrucomicrobiae bacterium]|nr:sugar phosphate isomerase/epimerase family protein [Verrucomicrobiae bacterium]